MRLYSGQWTSFRTEATHNQIAETLRLAYRQYFGYNPSISESNSWRSSLLVLSTVGDFAGLNDHGVMLEYQLPLASKRLDALITGHSRDSKQQAVVLELKQWSECSHADGAHQVITFVGGSKREVNHPSEQVRGYVEYLRDVHTAFQGPDRVNLTGCGFLHNYDLQRDNVLKDEKFKSLVEEYPLFGNHDFEDLAEHLSSAVGLGGGMDILPRIEQSAYRPSKKLMMHVADTIAGQKNYVLLDEQRVIYDKVQALVEKSLDKARKQVVIVKGGPGTGKSVIALNLMGDLSRRGKVVDYATGSSAFTETLRTIVGKRASTQFKYFDTYIQAPANAIDVLICDEAHRIRKTSNRRYTPASKRSQKLQIEELLHVARVLVLFIDDHQTVRPNEIGKVQYVYDAVSGRNDVDVYEYELTTQFRCGGSETFIEWVNNTLGIMDTTSAILENTKDFEFRICQSPEELEGLIKARVEEGFTARMMAGYCWPWSMPNSDGTLVNDVVIGDWQRPWNAKPESTRLADGIPKAPLWAYSPGGIDQVGCIYTAQGFEFDFAGIIVGEDFTYDLDKGEWIAHREKSHDGTLKRSASYLDYARNLYRVLLTRGMKGCYVYFMDKDTERFVRSRVRGA